MKNLKNGDVRSRGVYKNLETSSSVHDNSRNLGEKRLLTDLELYELIKESHGEAGFGDLNKTLMRLEIHGKAGPCVIAKRHLVDPLHHLVHGRVPAR